MTNDCVFYCTRSAIVRALECNADIDAALDRIEELRRQGKVRVVELTDDEVQTAYLRATTPSVKKQYHIRQVFGSRQHSASLFARGVPALVVQSASGTMAEDVFPHKESERIVTIHEALSRLFPNI